MKIEIMGKLKSTFSSICNNILFSLQVLSIPIKMLDSPAAKGQKVEVKYVQTFIVVS